MNNYSNPVSGLARLYEFLANCKLPVCLKAAESVSKMPEVEICKTLRGSPHYTVREGEIHKC